MDTFLNAVTDAAGRFIKWFTDLKLWIKVVIISVILIAGVSLVLGYSISKRNKIIRENKRVMSSLKYKNTMLELALEKSNEKLKIAQLTARGKGAEEEIKKGKKKLLKLEEKGKKLKEERKEIDKKTTEEVKKVDKMSVEEQIKKMNDVLGDTL